MLTKFKQFLSLAFGLVLLALAGWASVAYLLWCTGQGWSWSVAFLSLGFLWATALLAPRFLQGQPRQIEYRWY